jgi:hypothetical protein
MGHKFPIASASIRKTLLKDPLCPGRVDKSYTHNGGVASAFRTFLPFSAILQDH